MLHSLLTSLPAMFTGLWRQRFLIAEMTRREVTGRYRGSMAGMLWSFIHPLIMLVIYTFVFTVIFQTRWGGEVGNRFQYAMLLFSGLIIYNLFSETVGRSPRLVVDNASYVKKVVFPLEILPVTVLGAALFHAGTSLLVLVAATLVTMGPLPATAVLAPLVLIPLLLVILGVSWLLASLGVFLRDIGQVLSVLLMALLFLSPIFFPASALPEALRDWLFLNPLALPIESFRQLFFRGELPALLPWLLYLLAALLVGWLGYFWFRVTRRGFADVL